MKLGIQPAGPVQRRADWSARYDASLPVVSSVSLAGSSCIEMLAVTGVSIKECPLAYALCQIRTNYVAETFQSFRI